jgi:acyl-CoA synthetase (AMP-forming)/AMP-acid ligase II
VLTHRDVLRQLGRSAGQRPAIFGQHGSVLSFRELDRITDALGGALLGAGLRPGDNVVWLSRNSVEYFVTYFATAKAGLSFTPLNHWLRPTEHARIIGLLQPRAVFASDSMADGLQEALDLTDHEPTLRVCVGRADAGWSSFESMLAAPGSLERAPNNEALRHEVIFTSGTTGPPKGVTRSQRKRVLEAHLSALAWRVTGDDHMLMLGPQFHIAGAATPCQVLFQGGAVSVVDFAPQAVCDAVRNGVTFVSGVPTHFTAMHESGLFAGLDTSRVAACKLGGSSAPSVMFERVAALFPCAEVCSGYGMTETGPHTLGIRGVRPDQRGVLGHALLGNEVRVVGPDGEELPDGAVGELQLRSEFVFDGYYGQPDLTEAAFAGEWLRSGDLVRREADGLFFLAGRAKEMIISGGENVYPVEVEDVIAACPGVAEVAVFGVADDMFVERVTAAVRLEPGATTTLTEIESDVRSRLAGFKCPRDIRLVDEMPRTGSGKIAKDALRDIFAAAASPEERHMRSIT